MEEATEEIDKSWKRLIPKMKYFKLFYVVLIAVTVGYLHSRYVSELFENHLHFSHLSRLEREMSLRTEMGFYYSYYKTVVEERPFLAGITKLMYDRTVEYPNEVNAFNRFNIHPEVLIGSLYRYLEPWLRQRRHCRVVHRGELLSPVESCVGLGEPVMFYLEAMWAMAGLTAAAVFVCGVVLSDSVVGGAFAVAQYMGAHAHCTRAMWAPNQREGLAHPLLLAQLALLTAQLRGRGALALQVAIFVLNSLCLLFWQFTQFIFLTQTAIFFVMEQLRLIDIKFLWLFLHSHFCGLHMAVLLLQGNDMLKSSLYASFFIVVSTYCLFFSSFRIKVQSRLDLFVESWLVVLRIAIVICSSLWLKNVIADFLNVNEDGHIWEILYSKFTNYKSFHTMLYTCSEVFDFMPLETWKTLFVNSLIPVTLLAIFNSVYFWYRSTKERIRQAESERKDKSREDKAESDEDSGIENSETKNDEKNKMAADGDVSNGGKSDSFTKKEKDDLIVFLKNLQVDPGVFYNVSQMVVFGAMAALVMRLKLLFVPHMCLVSSLVMDTKQFPHSVRWYIRTLVIPLLFVYVACGIAQTVQEETSHIGEFMDPATEELLSWVASETRPSAVLGGPAPLLAAALLATRRAVVAHPHYEHSDVRDRTYAVYKSYGRFTPNELHQELSKLRVTHLLIDNTYCYLQSRRGCTLTDIWDELVPSLSSRPRLCDVLRSGVAHFYRVYENERYTVYHVHDYSVSYMPRALDT